MNVRLRLAHATVQYIAQEAGIDLLHIKGYSVSPGLYRPQRASSDVDVLVRPGSEDALVSALLTHGWRLETTFDTGSLFRHAAALWDDRFGHLDVHRSFPGITISAEAAFATLWDRAQSRSICHVECRTLNRIDHATLITLHAGRDGARGRADIEHLRATLDAAEFTAVHARAHELGADVAQSAALGTLQHHHNEPSYHLWRALASDANRVDLFLARYRDAGDLTERIRVLASVIRVNRDHLAMSLGYRPRWRDIWNEHVARTRAVLTYRRHHRNRKAGR
ncbi:MAG: nucleotidyltransferase family protein [Bowdeniella nasicola]|nr:nucleotidyltransferase family protein [Bowdeniella nasicola]